MRLKQTTSLVLGGFLLASGLLLLDSRFELLSSFSALAQTFTGPGSCAAGTCQGALGVNSDSDIGIGAGATTTARLYIVATTTSENAITASGTVYSSSGGFKFPDGTTQTTAFAGGSTQTITAANVSFGAFGSNTGGGNYTFPASVAVGTSTPITGFRFTVEAAVGAGAAFIGDSSVGALGLGGYSSSGAIQAYANTRAGSGTVDDLSLQPLGGSVGVGTTTPGGLFHAYSTGASSIMFGQDPTGSTASQRGYRIAPWSDGNLYFDHKTYAGGSIYFRAGEGAETGAARTWMAVDATNGNIGVGTTTPAVRLNVVDTTPTLRLESSAIAGRYLQMAFDGSTSNSYIDFTTGGVTSRYLDFRYAGSSKMALTGNGDVGIGVTTPSSKLNIQGDLTTANFNAGTGIQLELSGATNPGRELLAGFQTESNYAFLTTLNRGVAWGAYPLILHPGAGSVGIGTTTPAYTLTVNGTVASLSGGFRFPDGTTQTTAASGSATMSAANVSAGTFGANTGGGNYTFSANVTAGNYVVAAGSGNGVCFWADCTNYKFSMGTGADYFYGPVTDYSIKATMNPAEPDRGWTWGVTGVAPIAAIASNGNMQIAGTFTSIGNVTVGATGTGKINVGTVDPIYTIGGKKYATYLPAMTGQKEETVGMVSCEPNKAGECRTVIDFRNAEEGSDIWLFGKATDLERQFVDLTVQLTPAFDGRAWYKKNADKTLTIYGASNGDYDGALEISYRFTAPRFDKEQWSNRSKDAEEGFNLDKLLK